MSIGIAPLHPELAVADPSGFIPLGIADFGNGAGAGTGKCFSRKASASSKSPKSCVGCGGLKKRMSRLTKLRTTNDETRMAVPCEGWGRGVGVWAARRAARCAVGAAHLEILVHQRLVLSDPGLEELDVCARDGEVDVAEVVEEEEGLGARDRLVHEGGELAEVLGAELVAVGRRV